MFAVSTLDEISKFENLNLKMQCALCMCLGGCLMGFYHGALTLLDYGYKFAALGCARIYIYMYAYKPAIIHVDAQNKIVNEVFCNK